MRTTAKKKSQVPVHHSNYILLRRDGDNITTVDPEFAELERKAGLASAEHAANESMQTFVYSATLSKDLQQNLKKRKRFPGTGKKAHKAISTLGSYSVSVTIAADVKGLGHRAELGFFSAAAL